MTEKIILSEDIYFLRKTTPQGFAYILVHKGVVTEDPYPETGWGVSLFEELSKIKEVEVVEENVT